MVTIELPQYPSDEALKEDPTLKYLLKDEIARTVLYLDKLDEDKKAWVSAHNEHKKQIKDRMSKYAKAVKAGCVTIEDFNEWAAGE